MMPGAPQSDVPSIQRCADLNQLSAADFQQQLHTEFAVDMNYLGIAADGTFMPAEGAYPAEANAKLELVKVTKRKPCASDQLRDPFMLRFRGDHEVPLFNNTHLLTHESLGELAMFLTPVNASPGILPERCPEGRFYECVIS